MSKSYTNNFVAINKGLYPLVNFNFLLRVELIYDLPCKSVKAFTREMEYELIQEGGLNDYVHMRRKPISKPFTLEIERYAGTDFIDPLPLGADLALPVFLFVSRYQDNFLGTARSYVFTGCTVTKKTYGELQADRSGLLTDTITLAYREMICVDSAWSDLSSFPSTGTATNTLWDSKWKSTLSEQDAARKAKEAERKAAVEAIEKKLEALKKKEEAAQKAYKSKTDALMELRVDKQEELEALKEELIEQVTAYEATRKELLLKRETLVSDLKKTQAALIKANADKDQTRIATIKKERDEKVAELKELREEELTAAAAYEESLARLMEEREKKEAELKELQKEEEVAAAAYEKERAAILKEREDLVLEMQSLSEDKGTEGSENEAGDLA